MNDPADHTTIIGALFSAHVGRQVWLDLRPLLVGYRKQVASLHEALGDPLTRDQAFELIRSLIDEIRLVPEHGRLGIELRGELAGILELMSESTKARGLSTLSLAEQVKMVAGARNHLNLLFDAPGLRRA